MKSQWHLLSLQSTALSLAEIRPHWCILIARSYFVKIVSIINVYIYILFWCPNPGVSHPLGNRNAWLEVVVLPEQCSIYSCLAMKTIHCSSQVTDREREFAAGAAKQLEYQQLEDDKLSQKSYSSKLSRSPLKIVKKPKSMQCKVILLDGSEYTCDVEVSVYF